MRQAISRDLHTWVDLPYGPHARQRLDVMRPEGKAPQATVVAVHGGAWRAGDKRSMHAYGRLFAAMGIATVMPNYRLTDTHPHPAQEEDITAVLGWISEHGADYGLDPRRLGMTGSSAGGHLIALVGLKATLASRAYRVRCIAPVSGIFDFAAWLATSPHARGEVEPLLSGPEASHPALLAEMSPISHVHRQAPVCRAFHGEADDDVPCSQTQALVGALTLAGADARAILVPGAGHVAFVRRADNTLEPIGGLDTFQNVFRTTLLRH